jgi:methylthioribose-1-phosphate isomerase
VSVDVTPLRALPGKGVEVLDQSMLPGEERYLVLSSIPAVCEAICSLRVRGAPLLGIVGAAAVAIAAEVSDASDAELEEAVRTVDATRPTAADLAAGTAAALAVARGAGTDPAARRAALWSRVGAFISRRQDEDLNMGRLGAALLPAGASVLTHCNAGGLATGGIGTALGVVRTAWDEGRLVRCFATETRPLLQGARLTAWELQRAGVPVTLLPDTAAASLIASGQVQAIITGADRVAANGDTANKVGTYGLAAVAARHGVPVYIAAPRSTFDPACPDGSAIPIEFRSAAEVGGFGEWRWCPPGLDAYNPAFDVTPAELIAAIVTEREVLRPPFGPAIARYAGER